MQRTGMIRVGILLAIVYWPIEAFVHAILFSEGSFVGNLIYPDAHELWMRMLISVIFIAFGWYAQRGLDRQHLLQHQLYKKRERLQEMIDRCYDAYVSMDSEGKVTGWNRSAEEMFGWPRQNIIGQRMELLMPESMRAAHRKGMQVYQEQNIGSWLYKPMRTTGLHRDGSEFPVDMVVTPLNSDGEVEFFAFIRKCSRDSDQNLREVRSD